MLLTPPFISGIRKKTTHHVIMYTKVLDEWNGRGEQHGGLDLRHKLYSLTENRRPKLVYKDDDGDQSKCYKRRSRKRSRWSLFSG